MLSGCKTPALPGSRLYSGDDDDVRVELVLHLTLLRRCGRKVNICF